MKKLKVHDGALCPACGNDLISHIVLKQDACNSVYNRCRCEKCLASWTETYKLESFSELCGADGKTLKAIVAQPK